MNVLANDGISKEGVDRLNSAGFKTIVESIDQSEIIDFINNNNIEVLLVRSATKVRKDLIDSCENLKIIGRGGVGMDNIDVSYAKEKGIHVINTPAASSASFRRRRVRPPSGPSPRASAHHPCRGSGWPSVRDGTAAGPPPSLRCR